MRKIILQMNMSLDGITSGPNGEMDWMLVDPDGWKMLFDLYAGVDTVLLGRLNYEGFLAYWPAVASDPKSSPTDANFARWMNKVPKIVFSHTLQKTEWENSRLAQGDVASEIAQLKAQPGKDILVMNSTALSKSLLDLDLIDEYWLWLQPAIAGKGNDLFDGVRQVKPLKLVEAIPYPLGTVFLRYARA